MNPPRINLEFFKVKKIKALKIFWEEITSARLAIILLSLLLLLFIIGIVVPQARFQSDKITSFGNNYPNLIFLFYILEFFDIYNSPIFYIILGFFLINLLLCTIKTIINKKKYRNSPLSWNGAGAWGFIIIHVSLLLFTGAVFIDQGHQASGIFLIKEKMWFRGEQRFFKHGRYYFGRFRKPQQTRGPEMFFSVFFDKLNLSYKGKWDTEQFFNVTIQDSENKIIHTEIGVNRPLDFGGFTFTMGEYGYAPHIIFKNRFDGKILTHKVAILPPVGKKSQPYDKNFPLPDGSVLTVDLFPNVTQMDTQKIKITNKGYELKNPVFLFTLRNRGKLIGKKILAFKKKNEKKEIQNESVVLGNYNVGVSSIAYWSSFLLSEHPAIFLVETSIWLCFFGFILFTASLAGKKSWKMSD